MASVNRNKKEKNELNNEKKNAKKNEKKNAKENENNKEKENEKSNEDENEKKNEEEMEKKNEEEEEARYLRMDMKAIKKVKNLDKLKAIAKVYLEELKNVRMRDLDLKEEKEKLNIQYENTFEDIECVNNKLKARPNVISKMEESFEKSRLDGLCKLKYQAYEVKTQYRKLHKATVEEKLAGEKFFQCEMKNIVKLREAEERALEKSQYEWMEQLAKVTCKATKTCREETGNEDNKTKAAKDAEPDESEESETELDKMAKKDEADMNKWKQTIELEKKVWMEFQNEAQIDAYVKLTRLLESTEKEVTSKYKKILDQQFQDLTKLREKIAIQSKVSADINKEIEYKKEILEKEVPKLTKDRTRRYLNTLLRRRDNLMITLTHKEEKVNNMRKVLAKLEKKCSSEKSNVGKMHEFSAKLTSI